MYNAPMIQASIVCWRSRCSSLEFRQSRQYTARFLREAKAAGALSHPNIVTIFDVGEESGYPYIAMELLDGETLDVVVQRRGRLPAAEVTAIGLQLADALQYAHGLGVVHRDIKPSNIMKLCRDGQSIKLLDFGIAWIDEAELLAGDDLSLRTQVGQVLGIAALHEPGTGPWARDRRPYMILFRPAWSSTN